MEKSTQGQFFIRKISQKFAIWNTNFAKRPKRQERESRTTKWFTPICTYNNLMHLRNKLFTNTDGMDQSML